MNIDEHGRITSEGDRHPEPVSDVTITVEPFSGWVRMSLIADGLVRFQGPTSAKALRQMINQFEWAAGESDDLSYAERRAVTR